jgi:hypothetical protein
MVVVVAEAEDPLIRALQRGHLEHPRLGVRSSQDRQR